MLCRWLADPEFYLFWGGKPFADWEVEAGFFDGKDADVAPMIVEEAGRVVGYIQAWSANDRSGGIDIVLIPEARGKGVGVDAVRALARWLRLAKQWERITVDPLADNARAIRAFARAGFKKQTELPDAPEGPAILMVFDEA